jgi:glucose-6-phosphate isomerase
MSDATTLRAHLRSTLRIHPGSIADRFGANASAAAAAASGLWRHDPAAWSPDQEVQHRIAARLGWLTSPGLMSRSVVRLEQLAASVRQDGVENVVLLGMGGSSLAPEVLRSVLGATGSGPRFQMVDSTDPAAVRAAATPPGQTLYVLASKSGTTVEPNMLAAHFRERLERAGLRWGRHFIAITDEGTALAHLAETERFRDVFINPSDIGGRYSALSYFGLVPAALMGLDVAGIVAWGLAMLEEARDVRGARDNPAVGLGLAMATAALAGRDKLTLELPPELEAFGLWIEQLVAESTGKLGTGIVPIAGEPEGPESAYGADRFFARFRIAPQEPVSLPALPGGAPGADIDVHELTAIGAEFVRWEVATAVAGALMHINPFDEPNVQQAKDATSRLLNGVKGGGTLALPPPDRTLDGITLTLTPAARELLGRQPSDGILTLVRPGDYVALLAYLGHERALATELAVLRRTIRDATRAATMFGYGPRYLHSTGQLHKGGPNTGVFVLISASPAEDLPIPGQPFSFGTLELAQALGDFQSLAGTGRRALHVHLPSPDPGLLHRIGAALCVRLSAAT